MLKINCGGGDLTNQIGVLSVLSSPQSDGEGQEV